MDKIIRKHLNKYTGPMELESFNELAFRSSSSVYSYNQLYFFFKSELDVPRIVGERTPDNLEKYAELKKTSIRHLIPHRKGFFDYIVKKDYPTLGAWASDNGKTVDDIYYGRNSVHFCPEVPHERHGGWDLPAINYVTLNQLLTYMDPTWESVQVVDLTTTDEEPMTPEIRATVDRVSGILDQINALRISVEALRTV